MSTCPDKDIHCLYADNELQEPFKTEFEKHVNACPHCRELLQRYSILRRAVQTDTSERILSQQELDEGYLRLKARLSYKSVVMNGRPFAPLSFAVKLVPAAAVFALALALPLHFLGKTSRTQTNIAGNTTVLRAEPIQNRGIVASESIPAASLASALGTDYTVNIDMPKLTAIDIFKPELSAVNTAKIQIPLSSVSQMPPVRTVNTNISAYAAEDPFK